VSLSAHEPETTRMKLLPHQTDFVDSALNPAGKRIILLRGDVGLGKSAALVALAGRLLQEQPAARAVFLVPAALRLQFVEMLRAAGTPTLLVDRYRFREMLDATPEDELWPRGAAVVLARDFAMKPDILESLAKTHWDLVIADEAHGFTGARAEALQRVGATAGRVVLATATSLDLELLDLLPADDVTVVQWRRERMVDHDGRLLDTAPRPLLHEVPFRLTSAEMGLLEVVKHLGSVLEGSVMRRDLITKHLLRNLQSSPPALEGMLRRLVERLAVNSSLEQFEDLVEEESLEDQLSIQAISSTTTNAERVAREALDHIDHITVDSKFNAFCELLNRLTEKKIRSRHICILTDYLATLFYLSAAIENNGMHTLLLHGKMTVEDRQKSLMSFADAKGVMIATRAAISEGIALGAVTDLVLYDVPNSIAALQAVLAPFDRVGRRNQLNVHLLALVSNGR
jgi:Helicase conserved C-terminal domain